MAVKKREPRKDKMKSKPDLNIPIPIELLGSDQDPCFAKLFDPRANECSRCGDSEICAIAMGQKNHILRIKQEQSNSFKDIEEKDITPSRDPKAIRKSVKSRIRTMIKMGGGNSVKMQNIIDDVYASYNKDGYTQKKIKIIINKLVETSSLIQKNQDSLLWKN